MAYNIIATRKTDGKEKVLQTVSSKDRAESYCECWGWNYDDGQDTYWLDIEEIK
jgi:hypothetical protein